MQLQEAGLPLHTQTTPPSDVQTDTDAEEGGNVNLGPDKTGDASR